MSQENVEKVREAVEAINRGDIDAALDGAHPDIEWVTLNAFPDAGTYRGAEGIRSFFAAWLDAFRGFRLHLEKCVPVDDHRVLAVLRVSGEGTESGAEVKSPAFSQLLEYHEGRLIRARMFQTESEALEAAGLSEQAMSQENVTIIRDHYAATNARDFERAMSHYAEDVELIVPPPYLAAGTFSGKEAVGRWFGDWLSAFDRNARFDLAEIRQGAEGEVLVVAEHHARGKMSGAEVQGEVIWLYRLRDGKIIRVEGFDARAEALEAAGLSE